MQEKLKQVASTRVGTLAVRCSHSRRVPGPPGWGVVPKVRRSSRVAYGVFLVTRHTRRFGWTLFVMKLLAHHGGEELFLVCRWVP